MIPAPPLYPRELVSSGLVRCCRWFNLPFKRFARDVLAIPGLRLNFLNLWPLRPMEALFNMGADELLWKHTSFPYATAFLSCKIFERARDTALNGGPGMPGLLAAMQNVSGELIYRRFCPRCLDESIARDGESYWDRSHNLPGVFFCARHFCALCVTSLRASSSLKTIYDLPIECEQTPAAHSECQTSKTLIALARSSSELLERRAGPGEARGSDWYRQLAIDTGWLSSAREVNSEALQNALRKAFPASLLSAGGLQAHNLGWAALCFRPSTSFNPGPLKQLLVETLLKTQKVSRTALDHVPPGPGGTSCEEVDAFYAPKARQELSLALARKEVLNTEQFLRRVGAFGPYRHRAEQLPSLRQVVLAFRGSAASVKRLRPGKTLYRKGSSLATPYRPVGGLRVTS
jgi:hypothetical protein